MATTDEKVWKAERAIDKQLAELRRFVDDLDRGIYPNPEAASQSLRRWKYRTAGVLGEVVGPKESRRLEEERPDFPVTRPADVNREAEIYRAHLEALTLALRDHPDQVAWAPSPAAVTSQAPQTGQVPSTRTIFVAHGRDELNLRRLTQVLEKRWNLEVVVMRWEAGKGRTLIEKFEQEAQKAAFAFALMTPDDVVKVGEGDYAQARPNTVFELGWFYGRLGRDRVCILMREGTQIHSDLDGISRIPFDESVEEKVLDIERELKAAKIVKTE